MSKDQDSRANLSAKSFACIELPFIFFEYIHVYLGCGSGKLNNWVYQGTEYLRIFLAPLFPQSDKKQSNNNKTTTTKITK